MVLGLAKQCTTGVNPAALFMTIMQKQLGYRPRKKQNDGDDDEDLPLLAYRSIVRRYTREYEIDDPNVIEI